MINPTSSVISHSQKLFVLFKYLVKVIQRDAHKKFYDP
jgi:hypothetical protein